MHTLKVQLGLTLAIVLSLSMLLFGMVLLMLWQHHALQQEESNSQLFLQMVSSAIDTQQGETHFSKEILEYINKHDICYLQWQNNDETHVHSFGSCPEPLLLHDQLAEQASHATPIHHYSGIRWSGFFFSKKYLLLSIPINSTNIKSIGLIRSLEKVFLPIHKTQKIFFAYLIVNVMVFGVIGFTRLVHLVIQPIQHLTQLADSRTEQADSTFFTSERWGEFTQLSSSLNQLVSRIDGDKRQLQTTVHSLEQANKELQNNRDEMIRTEKLASIGKLSAGLAHEIGNPLGIIQGYVDLLAEDSLTGQERKEFSEKITKELDRINSLIRNLLDLSRAQTSSPAKPTDIHKLLHDVIDTTKVRKTSIAMEYTTDFTAEDKNVLIDSDGLRQVFLNCIFNAIDAIEEKKAIQLGEIKLATKNKLEHTIEIIIADNGIGLESQHFDSIFDPFFTTKDVGKGTGLGLAVTHNLIKNAGGSISFSSQRDVGSTITITLPTNRDL